MKKELVMYTRKAPCPFVTLAERVLKEHNVPYREMFIDRDPVASQRVQAWTGFLAVPTLVVAEPGQDIPYAEPEYLEPGASPRNIDRGTMLTEPSATQFEDWLRRHEFIPQQQKTS